MGLTIVVPIFKGKGGIMNCSFYRAMKLFEVVEVCKRFDEIMTVSEIQFGFLLVETTIDAVLILRRLQEAYHVKGKNCICFVDL